LKKADTAADELRPKYRREDFGPMARGKYATRVRSSSNVVVLDPEIAQAFPNSQAVNDALRGLLKLATRSARLAPCGKESVAKGEGHTRPIAFGSRATFL
jgi:hypothetical protein